MSVKIKFSRPALAIVAGTLQAIYSSKATNRKERSVLSIGVQVAMKFDKKVLGVKPSNLFDDKKKISISLLFYEADILEGILLQQIMTVEDPYIKTQIQKVINELNQKLA